MILLILEKLLAEFLSKKIVVLSHLVITFIFINLSSSKMNTNYRPIVINIDKSGSNLAAIKVYNKRSFSKIKIRQCKYLNNIVEQDHSFIKWHTQNGLGFKSFESAIQTLSGIEVVHMLRKNQMVRLG